MRTLLPIGDNQGDDGEIIHYALSAALYYIGKHEDSDIFSALWAIDLIVALDGYYTKGDHAEKVIQRINQIARLEELP